MNKIYRVIWDKETARAVVVSENDSAPRAISAVGSALTGEIVEGAHTKLIGVVAFCLAAFGYGL
ncbi:TPA: ESPR domain-containing protein, partial [Burkholderia vietnamiensis]|nr:ESPR domain-containing protein [Burkholderia vietnamiensis]